MFFFFSVSQSKPEVKRENYGGGGESQSSFPCPLSHQFSHRFLVSPRSSFRSAVSLSDETKKDKKEIT